MAQDKKNEVYLKIAEKAYSYYVARGFKHGKHMDDWLRAEKELMAEEARKKMPKKGR
ncbi:MAG: DUF2934 domain-containing protein [bacterium]|nr:DUF2934 domain-containing protein [bacterium]